MNCAKGDKGLVLVVSGPSGVGKGSVNKRLLKRCDNLTIAISATTRQRREMEVEGRDYFFISQKEFDEKVANNEFIEYAFVHGNMYGTLISEVYDRINSGQDVILEIDVQGGKSIKEKFPECVSVFILPPNMEELAVRLNGRATDDEETIKMRLKTAVSEVECVHAYDYAVVNEDLDCCVESIKMILYSEKHRVKRKEKIINELLDGGTI